MRHRVRVPVRIITNSAEVLQGFTNDLSEAGLGFYLSKRFEVGQSIRIELRPPGSQDQVSIDAIVRNCDGLRCGVEFRTNLETHCELTH